MRRILRRAFSKRGRKSPRREPLFRRSLQPIFNSAFAKLAVASSGFQSDLGDDDGRGFEGASFRRNVRPAKGDPGRQTSLSCGDEAGRKLSTGWKWSKIQYQWEAGRQRNLVRGHAPIRCSPRAFTLVVAPRSREVRRKWTGGRCGFMASKIGILAIPGIALGSSDSSWALDAAETDIRCPRLSARRTAGTVRRVGRLSG